MRGGQFVCSGRVGAPSPLSHDMYLLFGGRITGTSKGESSRPNAEGLQLFLSLLRALRVSVKILPQSSASSTSQLCV